MTTTAELDAALSLLEAGSVAELRILNTKQATVSGYFNDFSKLATFASQYDGRVPGIYVTLNPVNPSLLARAANKPVPYAKHTTSDSDILKRRWLPIDCDPVRPSGVSSTDAEHEAALERARQVREWLRLQGWPEPILADSGNGAHLLYRIDLPNEAASTELVRKCLEALSFEFSDDVVQIDVKTFNAARIWKLYGTMSAKGDNVRERPHRRSQILEAPRQIETVPVDLLRALAKRVLEALRQQTKAGDASFDLERWIVDHKLPVVTSGPWQGGQRWVLNPCPFDHNHNNRAAYIVQFASGAIAAGCHHNGCSWTWAELRARYEPEAGRQTKARKRDRSQTAGEFTDDILQRDYGHANVLATLFQNRYRWAVHRTSWMHYVDGVWRPVPEEAVAKVAADELRHYYALMLIPREN